MSETMEIYENLSVESLPNEEWRDIVGYEESYQVSNLGRVKSLARGIFEINGKQRVSKEKILKSKRISSGYRAVILYKDRKEKTMYIHRLVAQSFLQNDNNYTDVNHKDGNKENNCVENLEWVTRSYNIKHAYNAGLRKAYIDKAQEAALKIKSFPVLQYDNNNVLIAEYSSITQASLQTNVSPYYISKSCKGELNNNANYIWRYKI